jgi:opacity protein-like surface antigen
VIDGALGFFDRTEPIMGVGGGVIVKGGPFVLDLGYRYKKILADSSLQSLLNGGDDFDVSQVRVGVGVRF